MGREVLDRLDAKMAMEEIGARVHEDVVCRGDELEVELFGQYEAEGVGAVYTHGAASDGGWIPEAGDSDDGAALALPGVGDGIPLEVGLVGDEERERGHGEEGSERRCSCRQVTRASKYSR